MYYILKISYNVNFNEAGPAWEYNLNVFCRAQTLTDG